MLANSKYHNKDDVTCRQTCIIETGPIFKRVHAFSLEVRDEGRGFNTVNEPGTLNV